MKRGMCVHWTCCSAAESVGCDLVGRSVVVGGSRRNRRCVSQRRKSICKRPPLNAEPVSPIGACGSWCSRILSKLARAAAASICGHRRAASLLEWRGKLVTGADVALVRREVRFVFELIGCYCRPGSGACFVGSFCKNCGRFDCRRSSAIVDDDADAPSDTDLRVRVCRGCECAISSRPRCVRRRNCGSTVVVCWWRPHHY